MVRTLHPRYEITVRRLGSMWGQSGGTRSAGEARAEGGGGSREGAYYRDATSLTAPRARSIMTS